MKYQLDEILWEFTLKCNKNCEYCGSKKFINNEEKSKYKHKDIANYITKVKPKSVTITGGEPSCEMEALRECVNILYKSKIEVKILTNGNLFNNITVGDDIYCKSKCFGFSVNTWQDIQIAKDNHYDKYLDKTTVITNFGNHNIQSFDDIAKYAVQFPCWQIQLTMGNELQLDLNQIRELNEKIEKIKNSGLCSIVKADNFNCGKCAAGIKGFSITYDGKIIPCLSYRAWKSDIMVQGEVKDIVKIWKNGFKFNREREFVPCCKDITGIKKIEENNIDDIWKIIPPANPSDPFPSTKEVFVYGVVFPANPKDDYKTITTYGVKEPPSITYTDSTDSGDKK